MIKRKNKILTFEEFKPMLEKWWKKRPMVEVLERLFYKIYKLQNGKL